MAVPECIEIGHPLLMNNPVDISSYPRINGTAYRPKSGPFHALTVPGLRINGTALYIPVCTCI